jgi:hypothetical protein
MVRLGTDGIGFEDWDWVPMASDVKIGIGYLWHRFADGKIGIGFRCHWVADVKAKIGIGIVSVLAVYTTFSTTEGPRVSCLLFKFLILAVAW